MEENEGHSIEADKLMEKAVRLNDKDPLIWLTWGNIKKKSEKIKEAHEYYERAYKLSPDDQFVISGFGQAKSRLGQYAEADKLYRDILDKQESTLTMRQEVILRSGLADNLKRWAEHLDSSRNYEETEKRLKEALKHCETVVELDKGDIKSLDLRREVLISLGFFYKKMSQPDKATECFMKAVVKIPKRYREAKDTVIAALEVAKYCYTKGDIEKPKEICTFLNRIVRSKSSPDLTRKVKDFCSDISNFVEGKIIHANPRRRFTIIESLASPGSTYLGHIDNFVPELYEITTELLGKKNGVTPIG